MTSGPQLEDSMAQSWNHLKVHLLQCLMVGAGCQLRPQLECLACGLDTWPELLQIWWLGSKSSREREREREREGGERGTQLESPRTLVWVCTLGQGSH